MAAVTLPVPDAVTSPVSAVMPPPPDAIEIQFAPSHQMTAFVPFQVIDPSIPAGDVQAALASVKPVRANSMTAKAVLLNAVFNHSPNGRQCTFRLVQAHIQSTVYWLRRSTISSSSMPPLLAPRAESQSASVFSGFFPRPPASNLRPASRKAFLGWGLTGLDRYGSTRLASAASPCAAPPLRSATRCV